LGLPEALDDIFEKLPVPRGRLVAAGNGGT
jgi:hypothetical protein